MPDLTVWQRWFLRHMPWYDETEMDAKHERTHRMHQDSITARIRSEAAIAAYRRAEEQRRRSS